VENQQFGHYDTPNNTDQFLIDFSLEVSQNFKVHIDFFLVTGDVNFEIKDALSNDKINKKSPHQFLYIDKDREIFYKKITQE